MPHELTEMIAIADEIRAHAAWPFCRRVLQVAPIPETRRDRFRFSGGNQYLRHLN